MTIMQVSVPSSLFVDLYELTMAQGFLRKGLGRQRAIFHHFFRRLPWGCSFAVSAGLQPFCEWLSALHFERHQLESLAALRSPSGHPLFEDEFLQTLEHWKCELDLFAMPEGTLSFPHQPLIRVEGPLWQAQLLETALLNIVNFSTLVSSLAIPILEAAAPIPVWEFGARRAQGPNGASLASRSAWIAGCAGTSLLQASLDLEIPATGTMAHSWVMAFPSEEEAFQAYAELYPHQTSLLIDTLDTEQGALHACRVGDWLRSKDRSFWQSASILAIWQNRAGGYGRSLTSTACQTPRSSSQVTSMLKKFAPCTVRGPALISWGLALSCAAQLKIPT
jgi:nicotinate phosphoribosyltransferase